MKRLDRAIFGAMLGAIAGVLAGAVFFPEVPPGLEILFCGIASALLFYTWRY